MPDSGSRVVRGDPWPGFLDKLDSDPVSAKAEFVELSTAFLTAHPPPAMRRMEKYATRGGLIFELNERCCADDFSKLRTYRNANRAFQSWLFVVADRWCADQLTKSDREDQMIVQSDLERPDGSPTPFDREPDPGKSPEAQAIDRERQELIDRCIKRLSPRCQFLLTLWSQGHAPREIAKMLPPPPLTNKQVGDQLDDCRDQLRKLCLKEAAVAGSKSGGIK